MDEIYTLFRVYMNKVKRYKEELQMTLDEIISNPVRYCNYPYFVGTEAVDITVKITDSYVTLINYAKNAAWLYLLKYRDCDFDKLKNDHIKGKRLYDLFVRNINDLTPHNPRQEEMNELEQGILSFKRTPSEGEQVG